jgi:hypothetical protein
MSFIKAVGGFVKNIGKVASIPLGIPMAVVGGLLIQSTKFAIDAAATASAHWIKNNFTGQSTLFGASAALTSISESLGSAASKWYGGCLSGFKAFSDEAHNFMVENLNTSGWASTGTYDNDPLKDDGEDRIVKRGMKEYKEYLEKLREKAMLNKSKGNWITGEKFSLAQDSFSKWINRALELHDGLPKETDSSADKNTKNNAFRTGIIDLLSSDNSDNKSVMAMLNILGGQDLLKVFHDAKTYFEDETLLPDGTPKYVPEYAPNIIGTLVKRTHDAIQKVPALTAKDEKWEVIQNNLSEISKAPPLQVQAPVPVAGAPAPAPGAPLTAVPAGGAVLGGAGRS